MGINGQFEIKITLDSESVAHYITYYTIFDLLAAFGGLGSLIYFILKQFIPSDLLFLNHMSNITQSVVQT